MTHHYGLAIWEERSNSGPRTERKPREPDPIKNQKPFFGLEHQNGKSLTHCWSWTVKTQVQIVQF